MSLGTEGLPDSSILGPDPSLDLTLFASGATQHVFVETARPESGWLYKTPAAFGRILPFRPGFRSMPPWNRYLAALQLFCFQLPPRWVRSATRRAECRPDGNDAIWRVVAYAASCWAHLLSACGDRLLALYFRRAHRLRFQQMLHALDELSRRGLDDVLLPYRVVADSQALLRVAGRVHCYRGPILIQRRAQRFIERAEGLDSFDWRQFVAAQHRLWRGGIALADASEVLGPSNWALLNGRVLLGDTGSLTIDYESAAQVLAPEALNAREQLLLRWLAETERRRAIEYFAAVRKEINVDRFTQLWKADAQERTGEIVNP